MNKMTLLWAVSLLGLTGCMVSGTQPVSQAAPQLKPSQIEKVDKYPTFISRGDSLPQYDFETIDGEAVRLDHPGQKKLLILFATWCSDSQRAMKALNESDYLKDKELVVLAVAREESKDVVAKWRQQNNIHIPLAVDPERELFKQFASAGIPRFIMVDENNKVARMVLADIEQPLSLIHW